MAADLDMEAPGGEGWGDDAELQLDEGKFSVTKEYFEPLSEQIRPNNVQKNLI